MATRYLIYALTQAGVDFYVGRTNNPQRRLMNHRSKFGESIEMRELEFVTDRKECAKQERYWIKKLSENGIALVNKVKGSSGIWAYSDEMVAALSLVMVKRWTNPEYRSKVLTAQAKAFQSPRYRQRRSMTAKVAWDANKEKNLAQIVALGKRKRTEQEKEELSQKQKGRARNWGVVGRAAVESTQFKKGHNNFADLSIETQEAIRERSRRNWDGISKEERSRRATERNLAMWSKRTEEEKARIYEKVSATQRQRGPSEKQKLTSKNNGLKLQANPEMKEKLKSGREQFWRELVGERRVEFLAKRAAAIVASRKRNQGQR